MRLAQINIYPIKSTAGITLKESHVTCQGLELDRRWMLVDAAGHAITAREFPRLTLVRTSIADGGLAVRAPNMSSIRVPLQPETDILRTVQIWDDDCAALAARGELDRWFSDYLDRNCHLVRLSDAHPRAIDPDYSRPGDQVSFADAFPLLLTSEASLQDLNTYLHSPVSMQRFRPNLVVTGCGPYAEDHWRRIRIGEVMFEGAKNCPRCVLTTVDPETGLKDPRREPLRTLATYRRKGDDIFFGRNLIPRADGAVRVGDMVETLE
ncbi:MAG: MOSC domain-containing protein [Acidiferrobacterales bacterium]